MSNPVNLGLKREREREQESEQERVRPAWNNEGFHPPILVRRSGIVQIETSSSQEPARKENESIHS